MARLLPPPPLSDRATKKRTLMFKATVDISKCFLQIELQYLLHSGASFSELPSNILIMMLPLHIGQCIKRTEFNMKWEKYLQGSCKHHQVQKIGKDRLSNGPDIRVVHPNAEYPARPDIRAGFPLSLIILLLENI